MPHFAARADNPAVDVIGQIVKDRRINRLLDPCSVIRVQGGEEGGVRRRNGIGIKPEYPALLVRPVLFPGNNVPLPEAEMGECLRLIQCLLFRLKLPLGASLGGFQFLACGNVEMDASRSDGIALGITLDYAAAVKDPTPRSGLCP